MVIKASKTGVKWWPYDDHAVIILKWWPWSFWWSSYGHHMTTMVIIPKWWPPVGLWSSFWSNAHQNAHQNAHHIPFGQVCFFLLVSFFKEKFSNAPAQPCRQILGQLRFLSLLAAVKDKKRTCALCGNFLLVWVGGVFLPITTTLRWYWECFDIRPWGYVMICPY